MASLQSFFTFPSHLHTLSNLPYLAIFFDLFTVRSLHGVSWLVSCKSFLVGRMSLLHIPCIYPVLCLCVRAIL